MTVNFNTSRSRFDEWKRFTGVYQRMGQVAVDADWNEEVRLRTVDARRRTTDVADGSPDDGFRICGDFVLDSIRSLDGWTATTVPPSDERKPVPELRLDRHDPESLPWVLRSRWHIALQKALAAPIDLTAIARASSTPFAAGALIVELRLERPAADDEVADIKVVFADSSGTQVAIEARTHGLATSGWGEIVVPLAELGSLDRTKLASWGVVGLPPVARTWIGALRATDPALGNDVVIRGGDGTLPGAGRMLLDGYRAFLERDLRFSAQPDFPDAPALPDLPADGSTHHFFYLDVWEQTVTGLEDPFLLEPALDGADTAARLRVVAQVRALTNLATAAAEKLPTATGGGTLTTNIASGELPDRDPPERLDPCRDRCLFTENASTGEGYTGSDNLHVRVSVLRVGTADVVLWSRDNGSVVMALTQPTAVDSTTVKVSPADAARLRAGDFIVIEDRATRLRWDAPNPPVLRRLRGVQADTGILELDDAGTTITTNPVPLSAGGPVGRVFSPGAGASVRKWDGADLLVTGVRYRLDDGITFAFEGTGWRSGDYWSFTARVHAPDGSSTGVVEKLDHATPHGPIHHYTPLARASRQPRVFEDLRRRYLPLVEVRDRLKELGDRKLGPGVFVVVVGDGKRTFGDVDQSLDDGLTGDEAIQAAIGLLGADGGSIFIRTGNYQLEHPVLVRGVSSVRILGDGDSTILDVRGSGGAFYVDRCGEAGSVTLEDLHLVENPEGEIDIGEPGRDLDQPSVRVRSLFDRLIAERFSPIALPAERPLKLDDIRIEGGVPDFLAAVGNRLRVLAPGEGRVAGSVVATIIELRKLQRQHPETTLEHLPEAQPLLGALSALPHGVVTIADSRQITVRGCRIEARRPGANTTGIMVTGTCASIALEDNRIEAATGIAALPYAPYMANTFLVAFPRAGLALDGLGVVGNALRARGDAATGIHIADGLLSGTIVEGNLVGGYAVGILVDDQAEGGRDAAIDRIAVQNNRIVGATAIGVQVIGDGVDVVSNEIQGAVGESAFQAGVQLTGHSSRVIDCWIEVPSAPQLSPLAVLAGIVIGEGLDDGSTPSRPVFDVEIAGNRIEGSGEDSAALGLVVGGSQPVYDVRVRDNVIRNLGDAAVRTSTTSAPIGRLHIEGNRVERVALADLPVRADNDALLERLQPGIARTLPQGASQVPRSLLAALVDSSLPTVRAPLDAAMRWIERLTLRGAIVIAGVENGVVRGNRIAEVGRDGELAAPNIDGAEIRTSAIAVVAAAEVVVEDNTIEAVRAPFVRLDGAGPAPGSQRPEMLDVLLGLGIATTGTRVDRADVHLAIASLRARVLAYAQANVDQRPALARTLFGPLDAIAGELKQLGGAVAALSESFVREINQLRTAATPDDQRAAADLVRASLSQAASATAADDRAQDAWDTAAQLDLAITRHPDVVRATGVRILQRVDSLLEGLNDAKLAEQVKRTLRKAIEAPDRADLAAASVLGTVAQLRDQQATKKELPPIKGLVGPSRTIVSTFAEAAMKHLEVIGSGAEGNAERLEELRKAKEALVDQLREPAPELATDITADFTDVDRTGGKMKPAVERMRGTLQRVAQLAAGRLEVASVTGDEAARAAAQSQSAAIHLYAKSLDRQLGGLVSESEDAAQKSLASFRGLMGQLDELVADQPDLLVLSKQATEAVQVAAEDSTKRTVQLGLARAKLDLLRGRLIDILPPLPVAEPAPIEPIDRRIAALGALALELDSVDAANLDPALAAFAAHHDRLLDLVHADASERQQAHDAQADARNGLAGAPAEIRARAVFTLEQLVDRAADKALAADEDAPALAAAATLVHAATLAVDPGQDPAARITSVKVYVGERMTRVSAAVVSRVQQAVDVPGLTAVLHDALARVARGVDLVVIDARPPAFELAPFSADGVFAAGVERRARVAGNLITEVVSGVVVSGAVGHVMTEPPDDGMALEIGGNRVSGATVVGISARTDGASKLLVCDNQAVGCAGIAVATGDPWGQGVLVISGAGDLVVRGNVLADNGNTTLRAMLHEIVIDWRGPVGARGNTVRHIGAGAGGAGLLVITEAIDAGLIAKLAQTPFLGVEPAPRPVFDKKIFVRPDLLMSVRELAPLSPLAKAEDAIELGNMRQTIATTPILQRTLTVPLPELEQPTIATALVNRYVDRTRLFVKNPLIDFLRRPPIIFIPPRVIRGYDSVHVEGNDIDSMGPALLLLSNGNTLIAANVAGNDLRSRGRAGAVYVRRTDSTVFTGNRCECLSVVNVVVVRAGKAPLTVTGNVVVGTEPVQQIAVPPITKVPEGGVQLSVGLGGANVLHVPIDARALLGSLDRRKNLASDTFSELLADLGTQPAPPPAPAPAPAGPTPGAVVTPGIGRLSPRLGRSVLTSEILDEATRAALVERLPAGVSPVIGARTLYGYTAGEETDPTVALKKLVDTVALHEQDPMTTKTHVAAILTAAGGDPLKGLQLLDQDVLGLDTSKPTVKDALDKVSVIHEVLGDVLTATPQGPATILPLPPRPLPRPSASDRSLVVIGGTRVAVVGNATTAGVLVQDADTHVELNP